MIRSFIEQEKLPVRVTRSTSNQELLDLIEAALDAAPDDEEVPAPTPAPAPEPEPEPEAPAEAPAPERRRRR